MDATLIMALWPILAAAGALGFMLGSLHERARRLERGSGKQSEQSK